MKIGSKLVLIGVLSLLVGSVFASPLLIAELSDIRPYTPPLPKGATADIDVNVVYANLSIGDTYEDPEYGNLTDLSYFVVLNITNNCDYWASINMIQFTAAQNITKGISADSPFFGENSISSKGWDAEGAWVDGKWYNLTWVPHDNFWINCSALIYGEDMWGEGLTVIGEGYWMEGVQLMDKAVGGNVTNMYMNMNGTWTDVTSRVEWIDDMTGEIVDINPERVNSPPVVTGSGTLFMEHKMLGPSSSGPDPEIGNSASTAAPEEFNNLWAPHQSRLIVLSNDRKILTKLLDTSKIEQLKTEPITFRGSVHSYLNGTVGLWDSTAVDDEIKQVQMELTEDGYVYNTVLADNQMFVMDSYGVEVFIEPRN
jgi:hypothetical protein